MCENKKNVVVDDCLCFAINETLNHYKEKGIYPVQLQRGEVEENLNHSFGQWLSYMYTYLPRSAAESEYITMDYLSKEEVKKELGMRTKSWTPKRGDLWHIQSNKLLQH